TPLGLDVVARITGGGGLDGRWVVDGVAGPRFSIDADPYEARYPMSPPTTEARRARLEILEGTTPVTLTSHVWIEPGLGGISPEGGGADGCTVSSASDADDAERGAGLGGLFVVAAALAPRLFGRRRSIQGRRRATAR
ncbi:MAG TPA: hypothetical protein VL400_00975, partial [Polyangiaceae bacterium]|nr:hypothetical protein [Polyangiaceae bacterium]